jgi:epoxyqueuosine reductase
MSTSKPVAQPAEVNPRRPKRGSYKPKPETVALLKVSGNPINGLGKTTPRRPSPFLWHPPDQHPHGELDGGGRLATPGEHDE